jgi:hypothetical protein
MGLCLLLTYSRGSMIGLVIELGLVGALRYRKLLILLVAASWKLTCAGLLTR